MLFLECFNCSGILFHVTKFVSKVLLSNLCKSLLDLLYLKVLLPVYLPNNTLSYAVIVVITVANLIVAIANKFSIIVFELMFVFFYIFSYLEKYTR